LRASPSGKGEDLVGGQLDVSGAAHPRNLIGRAVAVDDEPSAVLIQLELDLAARADASARRTASGIVTWPFCVTRMA
jgi:hypothetical protein